MSINIDPTQATSMPGTAGAGTSQPATAQPVSGTVDDSQYRDFQAELLLCAIRNPPLFTELRTQMREKDWLEPHHRFVWCCLCESWTALGRPPTFDELVTAIADRCRDRVPAGDGKTVIGADLHQPLADLLSRAAVIRTAEAEARSAAMLVQLPDHLARVRGTVNGASRTPAMIQARPLPQTAVAFYCCPRNIYCGRVRRDPPGGKRMTADPSAFRQIEVPFAKKSKVIRVLELARCLREYLREHSAERIVVTDRNQWQDYQRVTCIDEESDAVALAVLNAIDSPCGRYPFLDLVPVCRAHKSSNGQACDMATAAAARTLAMPHDAWECLLRWHALGRQGVELLQRRSRMDMQLADAFGEVPYYM